MIRNPLYFFASSIGHHKSLVSLWVVVNLVDPSALDVYFARAQGVAARLAEELVEARG